MTTEAVLVAPVLILLIFTVIQFGLWYHASTVSRAAAQEGVRVARVVNGTAADGETTTRDFLAQTAGSTVQNPSVTVARSADVAEVTVHGTVTALVPGLNLGVTGHATAPVERFVKAQ